MRSKQRNRSSVGSQLSAGYRRGNAVLSRTQVEQKQRRQIELQRQESLAKKVRRHRRRIRLVVVIVLLLLLVFMQRSYVTGVSLSSSQALPSAAALEYRNAFSQELGEHSFMRQAWSVSSSGLEQTLIQRFPELQSVQVTSRAPLSTELQMKIDFRTPYFSWQDASGEQRYIDQNGVLFSVNRTPVKAVELVQIQDESGVVFDSGAAALSKEAVGLISELPAQLSGVYSKTAKSVLDKVILPTNTREVRAFVKGEKYYIKFTTTRPLGDQTTELKQALVYINKTKQVPKQYIDMRVADKVYYK